MKFFDRWKKRSFEEKMDDLSQTVLTENNIKDPKQVEQYVVERLEQMIDITDRKSTRLNSSHMSESRMPSSA